MAKKLKEKFDMILTRERRMAKSVALQSIKPKPFSVWEVLIPIVFIFGYMRSKEQREIFAQNLMFTKKMALEAAFEMLNRDHSKETVMRRIASETESLLSSIPNGVYSEAIRQQQTREMDLLIDHYCRLMRADGDDYGSLVVSAYQTKEDYCEFQDKLASAERKVTQAARQTLGHQTDNEMAVRIDTVTEKIRQREVEMIYNSHSRG